MLPRPAACAGCAFANTGGGFVPDLINPDAEVVVYAQGPGKHEEAGQRLIRKYPHEETKACPPQPLIGPTGLMLDQFMQFAALDRTQVTLANSVRCRPASQNQLPPVTDKRLQAAIAHCTRAYWKPSPKTKLYVAMGEYAMYALTGIAQGFNEWRGYVLPYRPPHEPRVPVTHIWQPGPGEPPPVLATFHLAYLFKDPEATLPTKANWAKIPLILNGKWPKPMPQIIRKPPDVWPPYSAFDTEFEPDHPDRLVRWSMATPDRQVYVVEAVDSTVRITIPRGSTIILHNAPVDIPHLRKFLDLEGVTLEDTMYANAVLWTGRVETDDQKGKAGGAMSHRLNFLGSLHSWLNRWKHLSRVNPVEYAGGDALGTMDVWMTGIAGALKRALERDPKSAWVYENLQKPLIPIILKHRERGIRTNPEAAKVALKAIHAEQTEHKLRAQAYAGWPINLLSSQQVAYWLYDVEKMRAKYLKPFAGIGGLRGQR